MRTRDASRVKLGSDMVDADAYIKCVPPVYLAVYRPGAQPWQYQCTASCRKPIKCIPSFKRLHRFKQPECHQSAMQLTAEENDLVEQLRAKYARASECDQVCSCVRV